MKEFDFKKINNEICLIENSGFIPKNIILSEKDYFHGEIWGLKTLVGNVKEPLIVGIDREDPEEDIINWKMAAEICSNDGIGEFGFKDKKLYFCLNTKDIFDSDWEDSEIVPWEEIKQVYNIFKDQGNYGLIVWIIKRKINKGFKINLFQREKLLVELSEIYEELKEENWDGYGSSPALKESFLTACKFIYCFSYFFEFPSPGCDPDGEITLEWINQKDILTISFSKENKISYAYIINEERGHGVEDFTNKIPEIFIKVLERMNKVIHY